MFIRRIWGVSLWAKLFDVWTLGIYWIKSELEFELNINLNINLNLNWTWIFLIFLNIFSGPQWFYIYGVLSLDENLTWLLDFENILTLNFNLNLNMNLNWTWIHCWFSIFFLEFLLGVSLWTRFLCLIFGLWFFLTLNLNLTSTWIGLELEL